MDAAEEGLASATLKTKIGSVHSLFKWAERIKVEPTIETIKNIFTSWVDSLYRRVTLKEIGERTVYSTVTTVVRPLAEVLETSTKALLMAAGVKKPRRAWRTLSAKADRQSLEDTFSFGHALLDITNSLSKESVFGPLPCTLQFRTGKTLEKWSGLRPPNELECLDPNLSYAARIRAAELRRAAYERDTSFKNRSSLLNLRIEAEMLIFIAQTGMNLAQVKSLRAGSFRYESYNDGYEIRRVYKNRRLGEVEFEIFSEYRPVFERYLQWRAEVLRLPKTSGLLFPFLDLNGKPSSLQPIRVTATSVKNVMKSIDVPYVPPRTLRRTRINWLLRKSDDPSLTAELAQNTQKTVLEVYQDPHHQRAAPECTLFWQKQIKMRSSVAPGGCVGTGPRLKDDAPENAPRPDCIGPGGCIFCQWHRDIDSMDYAWSQLSYQYLKTLEVAGYAPGTLKGDSPAELTIAEIAAKMTTMEASSKRRALWVKEARERIQEGEYHEDWDGWIRLKERRK